MSRPEASAALEGLPSEEMIKTVVHRFYSEIRKDDLLSAVFAPRLEGHWEQHLSTMVDFWSSILLTTGRYRGRPLAIHGRLGTITPQMWSRWLELFAETARRSCPMSIADLFIQRSSQIAAHLSSQLAEPAPSSELAKRAV